MPGLSRPQASKHSERVARLIYPRAFGAAVEPLTGHPRERMARREAQTDDAQQSQQATGTELDEFKKAISVCLEGLDSLAQN